MERALLLFEKRLPSTQVNKFPISAQVIESPEKALSRLIEDFGSDKLDREFNRLAEKETASLREYLRENETAFATKYSLTMTPSRIDIVAKYYTGQIMDVGKAIGRIKSYYDDVKKIELYFFKNHDINIVLEEDAIDYIIEKFMASETHLDDFYRDLSDKFEHGLKLVREKTGKNRFFVTRKALESPEEFIKNLLVNEIGPPNATFGQPDREL